MAQTGLSITPAIGGSMIGFLEFFIDTVFFGDVVQPGATPTQFTVLDGTDRLTVSGSGFTYAGDGSLTGGVFDSAVARAGNTVLGTIDPAGDITLAGLSAAFDAEEAGNTAAVENYFLGLDWNFTGTNGADIGRGRFGDAVPFNLRGDDTLRLLGGNDDFNAGDGDDTLIGGTGDDTLGGGRGNDRLFGGYGIDRLDGGAQNDVLVGGGDSDRFVFSDGYGRDRIADFDIAGDRIDLRGLAAIASFAALRAAAADTAAGVVIDAGADRLTLTGLLEADLRANDFIF